MSKSYKNQDCRRIGVLCSDERAFWGIMSNDISTGSPVETKK
jgi:hypothetical protein